MAQQIPGLPGVQEIRYRYELVSGRITGIDYNTTSGSPTDVEARNDRFQRRWGYDRDGRMTNTASSYDGEYWDDDARYRYGATGELARRELGEDKLAGLDYTYTAQGMLKGINAPNNANDPGGDSVANRYGADGFSEVVNYYHGDFARTGHPLDSSTRASKVPQDVQLYDGTITSATVRTDASQVGRRGGVTSERYRYDAEGRLMSSRMAYDSASAWRSTDEYSSDYQYDANGNLQQLKRNAYDTVVSGMPKRAMDDLSYQYASNAMGGKANRLDQVNEAVTGEPYADDMEMGQAPMNYKYDASGALIEDVQIRLQ